MVIIVNPTSLNHVEMNPFFKSEIDLNEIFDSPAQAD